MTEPEMATFITEKIVKDVQFWTATIGFSGVIAGAIISTVGNVVREFNFEVRHSPMPPDGTLRIP